MDFSFSFQKPQQVGKNGGLTMVFQVRSQEEKIRLQCDQAKAMQERSSIIFIDLGQSFWLSGLPDKTAFEENFPITRKSRLRALFRRRLYD